MSSIEGVVRRGELGQRASRKQAPCIAASNLQINRRARRARRDGNVFSRSPFFWGWLVPAPTGGSNSDGRGWRDDHAPPILGVLGVLGG